MLRNTITRFVYFIVVLFGIIGGTFLLLLLMSISSCAPEEECFTPTITNNLLCVDVRSDCPDSILAYHLASSFFAGSAGEACGENVVEVTDRFPESGERCRVTTTFHTFSDNNGVYAVELSAAVRDCYLSEVTDCDADWTFELIE